MDQPRQTLQTDVAPLMPGRYILQWQVWLDGHITRGELPFRTQ
jgi:methionine-rich copper-binding protein CopC